MPGEQGFASFYATHHPRLWAFLVRMGASPAAASDLAQDAFVRWLERDNASFEGSAQAYLFRIAQHLFIDHVRRNRREVAWDSELEDVMSTDAQAGDDGFPRDAWARLPLRQRQLLWLAYAEGFRHDEIAAITGLAPDGIRVLLSRARARFVALQEEKRDAR
jgi:RNA polymerase sigma-70 factor (ECF subfamily)